MIHDISDGLTKRLKKARELVNMGTDYPTEAQRGRDQIQVIIAEALIELVIWQEAT